MNWSNQLHLSWVNFHLLPNRNLKIVEPIFLSSPPLVVGIPVFLANFCFTEETPIALFQEKLNPNFLPIITYLGLCGISF
jgi:hypothetical protein